MAKQREVQMPEDWNDHSGWNRYYAHLLARPKRAPWSDDVGSISIEQLPQIANDMRAKGWRTVWIPGCGLSPLAKLLCHLGLDVFATDVSAVAVSFQQDATDTIIHLKQRLGTEDTSGSLIAEVHDFRTEYHHEQFDLILNVKSFQAFPVTDLVTIARVHAQALKKGRNAFFDTMNVQGASRDNLELALEDGGFVVPLMKLNQWYRKALVQTGIPHVFVLGRPMIPRTGEYGGGGPIWEQDMARLREISSEYQSRLQAEQASGQSSIGLVAKVAQIIYSTG